MNFKTHNEKQINTNLTSYQGGISISYENLVEIFGEPLEEEFDDYKCDAEWNIEFDNGLVATIYNYKNGKNYLGEEGLETWEITNWNIGGFKVEVVNLIKEIIIAKTSSTF